MAEVKHSARKHALLSASGASRWLNCTPSARIEEKIKETRSVHADEGTLAHEFANFELEKHFGRITEKEYSRETKKLRKHELYSDEMGGEVAKYVDYVIETFNVANTQKGGATIQIEEQLDFSHIVEQGFGTGDSVVIADGVMEISDLKYGKGVKVFAKENPQLMLYGLGALRIFELAYEIETVRLTIFQPRLDHVDSWEISVADLYAWAENEVQPKSKLAYEGEGELKVGDWCKFCKAKAMCRATAEHNLELAKHEFRDPHRLSDEELIDIYSRIDLLVDWANSIGKYMLDEAVSGKDWPGFKVVEGRSNRKWADELKVIAKLEELGYKKPDFTKETLKGITDIERLLGKADFAPNLNSLVIKPQGAPTLVSESDKRPAMGIEQAKKDFS